MFRRIILILLAASLTLMAQSQPKRKVRLNLCCLRYSEDVRAVYVKQGDDSTPSELRFYQGGFTEPVTVLVENRRIIFYQKGEEGQAPWVPAWSMLVPSDSKELSVIFLPRKNSRNGSKPYFVHYLPTTKDFDYGTVWIVNLSPLRAKFDVGKSTIALEPGNAGNALLKPYVDSYNMVPMTAWVSEGKTWSTLHSTRWAYHDRYREAVLLWIDPTLNRPEVTTLREYRPAPTALAEP